MEKPHPGFPTLSPNPGSEPKSSGAGSAIPSAFLDEPRTRLQDLSDFILHAPVALNRLAEDGTILWANDAELQLLGRSREEYIGHNLAEFYVDQAAIREMLYRLSGQQQGEGRNVHFRTRDGSIRYVTIHASTSRESGKALHMCVTTIRGAQSDASEVHQRLAAIVESSDDAILSKDLNGIILSWNCGAERIFGYTAEEIVGKHISTLAVPDRLDEFPDILDRIRRGERVDHYETLRKAKDGRIVNVSLTVSPVRDESGTIVGASKVARDITERRRQEQALREVNAALTRSNADLQQFAYSASHDLQEPLRMVATYAEMLKRRFGAQLGQSGDEFIGYIIQGALRMEQLLKDLREYAQASLSVQEPAPEIDAETSLDAALANLDAAIRDSGATVTRGALPRVCIHGFQLEQLFQNLIGNSVRYRSGNPPRIHVAAVRRDKEWLFSVQDNGIGIAPKYRNQVFGLFKRLHSAAEYPGTGMGLAICQRIVERNGGRIWVDSEQDRGSTFFFTVPS